MEGLTGQSSPSQGVIRASKVVSPAYANEPYRCKRARWDTFAAVSIPCRLCRKSRANLSVAQGLWSAHLTVGIFSLSARRLTLSEQRRSGFPDPVASSAVPRRRRFSTTEEAHSFLRPAPDDRRRDRKVDRSQPGEPLGGLCPTTHSFRTRSRGYPNTAGSLV